MDLSSKNDIEQQKRNDDAMNFQSSNMSLDWQLSGSNFPNSNPLVDSICPTIWDRPTNSPNLSYYGSNNVQINPTSTTNPHEIVAMLKGGMFVPPCLGMLPQSLPQLPADSGFIERAARFSCFSAGNLSDMMNPFNVPESMKPCYRGLAETWRPEEVSARNGLNSPSAVNPQKQQMGNEVESSKDVSLPNEHGTNEESPLKNEKRNDNIARSQDEGKESVGLLGNESDEAECSGRQEEMEGAGSRKRKRYGQETELDQMKRVKQPSAERAQDQTETQKGEQNLKSTASKPGGNNGKQGSQASDPPKEDYIHVRARRGQATNSHSLAERVRREKISERMKYLQDLVPGCNKVTGKAVMLDEIINYVQSLQRQVEFLSMKLATVNPQLDFNIDGLLAKDILQSRAGPSSALAFPPDMTIPFTSLHALQSGLLQSGFPGMGYRTDASSRSINSHFASMSGGYKDPSSQVPNAWDDQLHNVVDMGFNSNVSLNNQDLSSLPPGQMKAEP